MPVARPEPREIRVIAHLDLDCFYVQVEQRRHPELRGKPTGVVQYNPWKGGALIAVGYEARKYGVKRSMRGDEAKAACPDIQLVQVPVAHGKADLTVYRDAGSEVVSILAKKGRCERASIDEAYLDITEASAAMLLQTPPARGFIPDETLQTNILGVSECEDDKAKLIEDWLCKNDSDQRDRMLACGAIIIAELRLLVLRETQFTCSAGIAHNKMLAKLASAMYKPAQQTVIPYKSVSGVLASFPIKKMKQLGGKLGDSLQADLGVTNVGDLRLFSESKLQHLYGVNTGSWLWRMARGLCGDAVIDRTLPKSHSCGKTFPGLHALTTIPSVEYWLGELSEELQNRLDLDLKQNHRTAHLLTIHMTGTLGKEERKFPSKSCVLRYGNQNVKHDAIFLFEHSLHIVGSSTAKCNEQVLHSFGLSPTKWKSTDGDKWTISALFLSASNISTTPSGVNPITRFYSSSMPEKAATTLSVKSSFPETSCLLHVAQISDDSAATDVDRNGKFTDASLLTENETPVLSKCGPELNNPSPSNSASSFHLALPVASPEQDATDIPHIVQLMDNNETFQDLDAWLPVITSDCYSGEEKMVVTPPEESDKVFCTDGVQATHILKDTTAHTPSSNELNNISKVSEMTSFENNQLGFKYGESASSQKGHVGRGEACEQVIVCSVMEDTLKQSCHSRSSAQNQAEHQVVDLPQEMRMQCESSVSCARCRVSQNKGNKRKKNSLSSLPQGRRCPSSLQLEDLWQRSKQANRLAVKSFCTGVIGYNSEEIDKDIVAELPEEIQEELLHELGMKSIQTSKQSTIGEFFKSYAS